MYSAMKCKKCRKTILSEDIVKNFVDAHKNPFDSDPNECETVREAANIYLTTYSLPPWILEQIEAEEWKKGKLHCPHCQNKIGAFDHLSGHKCKCLKTELAPISFSKSKIDLIKIS